MLRPKYIREPRHCDWLLTTHRLTRERVSAPELTYLRVSEVSRTHRVRGEQREGARYIGTQVDQRILVLNSCYDLTER